MAKMNPLGVDEMAHMARALSDPMRLRLLMLLAAQELHVCELAKLLRIPQPTLSHHLSVLRRAGLVCRESRGRWRLYRLGDIRGPVKRLLADLLEDESVKRDMEVLRAYLKEGRDLCRVNLKEDEP